MVSQLKRVLRQTSAVELRTQLTVAYVDISEIEYRISILLDIVNDDGDDSGPPTILLQVKYPNAYPDEAPMLDILPLPNAPIHPFFNVGSDKQRLRERLSETIEENMGMAMVFTLVSTIKDKAEELISKRQAAARLEHEQKLLAAEAEENKKFNGTPVNPETFNAWREGFKKEIDEIRTREDEAGEAMEKKKHKGKDALVQLTGKQLWERGMVGKIEEDEEQEQDNEENDEEEQDGEDHGPIGGVENLNVES